MPLPEKNVGKVSDANEEAVRYVLLTEDYRDRDEDLLKAYAAMHLGFVDVQLANCHSLCTLKSS